MLSEIEKTVIATVSKKRGAGSAAFRIVDREEVVYALSPETDEVRSELVA
jgi:phenylalanyl-tRNA synthetase alpha chain